MISAMMEIVLPMKMIKIRRNKIINLKETYRLLKGQEKEKTKAIQIESSNF